jgi:hypothetical protein
MQPQSINVKSASYTTPESQRNRSASIWALTSRSTI